MQEQVHRVPVRVFISSPSDVAEERQLAQEVLVDLDRLIGPKLGITLEPLLWEYAVPDMGPPQDTINRQYPYYDIFIGIMWARFGTPTSHYGSGTEEEFSSAHAKWTEAGTPRILFYLCSRDVPFPRDESAALQLTQVVRFRADLKGRGLTASYSSSIQFRTLLWEHLFQLLYERYGYRDPAASRTRQAHSQAFEGFDDKLDRLVWVCYSPVNFDPDRGVYPDDASLREDLLALSRGPFTGIVTFGSEKTLSLIPRIAKECGLKGVIMGVHRPDCSTELESAIQERDYIDGYCIGHLALHEYCSAPQLALALARVREETSRPVTTTERIPEYLQYPILADTVDWIFPDVHYYWHQGVDVVEEAVDEFVRLACATESFGKRVLLKMVSFPSEGGAGLSSTNQILYFRSVSSRLKNDSRVSRRTRCAFFAAFDSLWKTPDRGWSPAEQWTGLYDAARNPKPVVNSFLDGRWIL